MSLLTLGVMGLLVLFLSTPGGLDWTAKRVVSQLSVFPEDALRLNDPEVVSVLRGEAEQEACEFEWHKVEMIVVYSEQVSYIDTHWKRLITNRSSE